MNSKTRFVTALLCFCAPVLFTRNCIASPLTGTYAGIYPGNTGVCQQGPTPIVFDFDVNKDNEIFVAATIYNIPGMSNNLPTVLFTWSGVYNPASRIFTLINPAILGNASGYVTGSTQGKLNPGGKSITVDLCGGEGAKFQRAAVSNNTVGNAQ